MLNITINISNKKVAYAGAKIAIAGVFGYAALVMLYAIIRSSITIYHIMQVGNVLVFYCRTVFPLLIRLLFFQF